MSATAWSPVNSTRSSAGPHPTFTLLTNMEYVNKRKELQCTRDHAASRGNATGSTSIEYDCAIPTDCENSRDATGRKGEKKMSHLHRIEEVSAALTTLERLCHKKKETKRRNTHSLSLTTCVKKKTTNDGLFIQTNFRNEFIVIGQVSATVDTWIGPVTILR